MASEITAVVYGGVAYPITDETGRRIIRHIEEDFEVLGWRDFIELPTTDGRSLILNVGPSLPIAFEAKPVD